MLQQLGKYIFMVEWGFKYISLFKKIYTHPFKSLRTKYLQLSHNRQDYSNKVLEFLNIEVALHGTLPEHNKVLYAINHRSLLDIIVMEHLFSRYEKNGVWIAKQELFDAFYGDFFRYSGCISVDIENKKGLLHFFKKIKKILAKVEDLNIFIFPEGERHKGKGVKSFQSGAAKIAKANGLEVLPVYINDTLESVFQESPYKETKTIEIYVGSLCAPEDLEECYAQLIKKAENG